MSTSQLLFPEFRDEQRDSKYPFSDRSTFTAIDNALVLSKQAFVDATIYIIDGRGAAYISEIASTGNGILITVRTTGNTSVRARGFVVSSGGSPYSQVDLRDRYNRPAGLLVLRSEQINFLLSQSGTYSFREDALEFVATCFSPATSKGLTGVLINETELVTGNILLVGHNGVVVRKITDEFEDYQTNAQYNTAQPEKHAKIRIDVVGDPLFQRIQCEKEGATLVAPEFIKTINGVAPDEFGHFIFTVSEDTLTAERDENNPVALRIYPTAENSLTIEAVSRKES